MCYWSEEDGGKADTGKRNTWKNTKEKQKYTKGRTKTWKKCNVCLFGVSFNYILDHSCLKPYGPIWLQAATHLSKIARECDVKLFYTAVLHSTQPSTNKAIKGTDMWQSVYSFVIFVLKSATVWI